MVVKKKRGATQPVSDLLKLDTAHQLSTTFYHLLTQHYHPNQYSHSYNNNIDNSPFLQCLQHPSIQEALDQIDHLITSTLHGGYNQSQFYTWLGQASMIALAPPHSNSSLLADLNSNDTQQTWYKAYKNMRPFPLPSMVLANNRLSSTPKHSRILKPHVFALANALYFHLRRSGVDQSIIIRGESGSSKSLQTNLIIQQLCQISGNSKRNERIHSRVLAAQTILNAFGCAKTTTSIDSSRFGAYYEIQFNERGKLIGMKLISLGLQRNRILHQKLGERNFHVFYHLICGGSTEQLSEYGLHRNYVYPFLTYGANIPVTGVDDLGRFAALQNALRLVGISNRSQNAIWKLLAVILHLSNLTFVDQNKKENDCCEIANMDLLQHIALLLELDADLFASGLTTKTRYVGRDLVTQLLTTEQAIVHRDSLALVLYQVLYAWIIEQINKKLAAKDDMINYISIIDFPDISISQIDDSDMTSCMMAYASEQLDKFVHHRIFEYGNEEVRNEGVPCLDTPYNKSTQAETYLKNEINQLAKPKTNFNYHSTSKSKVDPIIAQSVPEDFIYLFRGGNGRSGSGNPLYHDLFSEAIISIDASTDSNPPNNNNNTSASMQSKSLFHRSPSKQLNRQNRKINHRASFSGSVRSRGDPAKPKSSAMLVMNGKTNELLWFVDTMSEIMDALDNTHSKTLFCLRANADDTTAWDGDYVSEQLARLYLDIVMAHVTRRTGDYTLRFLHTGFLDKYAKLHEMTENGDPAQLCAHIKQVRQLPDIELYVGPSLVILRDDVWIYFENMLRKLEHDIKSKPNKRAIPNAKDRPLFHPNGDARSYDGESVYSEGGEGVSEWGDTESTYGESLRGSRNSAISDTISERNWRARESIIRDMHLGIGDPKIHLGMNDEDDTDEELSMTTQRRRWVWLCWLLTWWMPTLFLRWCGGMKRPEVRMAFREKCAICIIIFWICVLQLFLIIGFGRIICPRQNIFNMSELRFQSGFDDQLFVGIHGAVYDLKDFVSSAHDERIFENFAGKDISSGFRRTPSYYCSYANNQGLADAPPIFNQSDVDGAYIYLRHRPMYERNNFFAQRALDQKLSQEGRVHALIGWDPADITNLATSGSISSNRLMVSINSRVYDLTGYKISLSQTKPFIPDVAFQAIVRNQGKDMSSDQGFMNLWRRDQGLRDCFNNLFVVGVVDKRKSPQCLFTNYILLAFSVMLACIIGGKFLSALQLNTYGDPEDYEKFIITFVPCYTESEESLRRTIDSLAVLRYDDKRKLMFIVCDGNIMGSGNDRPTPRIVLDILGVDPSTDPEPLSFHSLGEGMRQHNMGKIYAGLYECAGHLVPYLVVVKVGKPAESSKPGNRGKRDSQMILMRFLNKVCYDTPMSPMELEMYHQIKNVIGVNPAFYEHILMVDADTTVMPDSLARLVSVMVHDTKVMGVCGETRLSNEKDTWATMIQPYEYFISHHLAKAFESLFGTVTCLPGCFSMYRIRSPNKNDPLLVSHQMIVDYGENTVDTLHKKNLLHLGEDRYLTTLLLKNFPNYRTVFTAAAKCDTVAPDQWSVLLSQRRRWINSTVHNLVELLGISQLCGFCCFSMRFVVLFDLVATLIQPAIVLYLGYLIYLIVVSSMGNNASDFPMISLILLATIYGLQAIVFLVKREWQHVGWMFIYILAIPVFSFSIPLYSFWHMDDFAWGQTRVVINESKKKKKKVTANGEESQVFSLAMIPHKTWSDYEAEMYVNGGILDPVEVPNRMSQCEVGSTYSGAEMGMHYAMIPDDLISHHSGYSHTSSTHQLSQPKLRRSSSSRMGEEVSVNKLYVSSSDYNLHQSTSPSSAISLIQSPLVPSDQEIYFQVQQILSTADLMSVTKKQVRDELSVLFHIDLTSRRDFINQCITDILNGVPT